MFITFIAIGIPFIILGFVLKAASDGVVELSMQYDGPNAPANLKQCSVTTGGTSQLCTVSLTVNSLMKAPVFVYYQLDNFYQNHRRYVTSKSDSQLQGNVYTDAGASQLTTCQPLITNSGGLVLDPCGLIANSYFNDTFTLQSPGLAMDESNIAWPSDLKKFTPIPLSQQSQYPTVQFTSNWNVSNEHFIVWMRTAALPNFRKLYGRINTDLQPGTVLNFQVNATYPVTGFGGSKFLVVSTTSFMGGKNPFLGIAYLVVGFACVAVAALFAVKQYFGGRRLGDTSFLVWQQSRR